MKRIIVLLLIFIVGNVSIAKTINVPQDTVIKIAPRYINNCKKLPKEYNFEAMIKEDVIIDGVKVFALFDKATLNISDYRSPLMFGTGAKLTIQEGYVYDTNGNAHLFTTSGIFKGKNDFIIFRLIPWNKGHHTILCPSANFRCTLNQGFTFSK